MTGCTEPTLETHLSEILMCLENFRHATSVCVLRQWRTPADMTIFKQEPYHATVLQVKVSHNYSVQMFFLEGENEDTYWRVGTIPDGCFERSTGWLPSSPACSAIPWITFVRLEQIQGKRKEMESSPADIVQDIKTARACRKIRPFLDGHLRFLQLIQFIA